MQGKSKDASGALVEIMARARGGNWYLKLDTIRVKGLSKHTLNTYFSGMKIDTLFCTPFS